jgi:hypothetical protein
MDDPMIDDALIDEADAFIQVIAMTRKRRMDRHREAELQRIRTSRSNMSRSIRRRWGAALDAYDRASVYAVQLGGEFNHTFRPEAIDTGDPLVDVLTRLHAKACLVAFEVRSLLGSGFASEATARWRTLHEISVVALFFEEHGRDAALRYWQHGAIEQAKWATEYQESGLEPLDPQTIDEIAAERDAMIERWGRPFRTPYGWAAQALGNDSPSFRDIENAVGMGATTRWAYRLASFAVHAQVWGLRFDLGLPAVEQWMLAGPSLLGLAEPGMSSLNSLLNCTAALVMTHPDDEWLIRQGVLRHLIDDAIAAFTVADAPA